jgi:transposase
MTDRAPSGPASFSGHDRRRLATALRGTSDVRLFRRVQAVLRVAEGDPISAVARSLRISRRSVQRWVEVYWCRRHPEDLLDARRSGRPRATDDLTQAALAELLAQDPRTLGYRATTWTTPLLAAHLQQECGCPVSEHTLRRRLHEDGWRWKRPRYVFCERETAVGQKKGASADDGRESSPAM